MSYITQTAANEPTSIDNLLEFSTNAVRNVQSDSVVGTARSRSVSPDPSSVGRAARLYTAESLGEINNLPVVFELKRNSNSDESGAYLSASDYTYLDKEGNVKPHIANKPAESPNPYKHLPQYRTNYHYGYPNEPVASLSYAGSDTNTVNICEALPDVFSSSNDAGKEFIEPIAPHTVTLNKRAFEDVSQAEIRDLNVSFEEKQLAGGTRRDYKAVGSKSCETLNKRLLTQESIMYLSEVPALASLSDYGMQVLRDFCVESLEDLRLLPSLSSISLNHEESDVKTANLIIQDNNVDTPEYKN